MRSCVSLHLRLLLLIGLISAPTWTEARPDASAGMGLQREYHLSVRVEAPAMPTAAPGADNLQLRLAYALERAPAPVGADSLPTSIPGPILGAILLFLSANIVMLLCFSIVMRIRRERDQRRRDRFSARWEPVLHARMSGDAAELPYLAPSERLLFLGLWLHLLGYVRDQAADALVVAARELDMPNHALRLLESRSPWKRLVAMRALAAMNVEQAGDALFAQVMKGQRRSSLAAARALMQIDPDRGFVGLEHLLHHLDWSPAAMVEIVKAGGNATAQRLAHLVSAAARGRAKQLVRLIELLEDRSALPALRARLASGCDAEEAAAILHCLGRLGQEEDRSAALGFLAHANWLVRMQAAYALGAIGLKEDIPSLAPLLRDRNWWVRYRAAQSLLRLAGATVLVAMRASEPDPYARDMLERVLAESG